MEGTTPELSPDSTAYLERIIKRIPADKNCLKTATSILKLFRIDLTPQPLYDEWKYESDKSMSYHQFVVHEIKTQLERKKRPVVIDLDNSGGNYGGGTLTHVLTLFNLDGHLVRLESYENLYCNRVTIDDSFLTKLSDMIEMVPGQIRLHMWNSLFFCNEKKDNNEYIDVSLHKT
jgi:hypothetical protein